MKIKIFILTWQDPVALYTTGESTMQTLFFINTPVEYAQEKL